MISFWLNNLEPQFKKQFKDDTAKTKEYRLFHCIRQHTKGKGHAECNSRFSMFETFDVEKNKELKVIESKNRPWSIRGFFLHPHARELGYQRYAQLDKDEIDRQRNVSADKIYANWSTKNKAVEDLKFRVPSREYIGGRKRACPEYRQPGQCKKIKLRNVL